MARIAGSIGLLLAIIVLAGSGAGQEETATLEPLTRENPSDLPHLVSSLPQPNSSLARTQAVYDLFASYSGGREVPKFCNRSPTRKHKVRGKSIDIVYCDWVIRSADGQEHLVYVPPNRERQVYDIDELDKLDRYIARRLDRAISWALDDLSPESIREKIHGRLQEQLGYSRKQLKEELSKEVELSRGEMSVREVMNIPDFSRDEFAKALVPDRLVISELPDGILGATNVSPTGGKSVVMLSPDAVRQDFVLGDPYVLRHELIHANSQVQGIPFSWYFDVELFAELSSLSTSRYPFNFYFHGYLEPVRRAAKAFFSFDADEAASQLFDRSIADSYRIDEERFNELESMTDRIAEEMKWFTSEVLYPRFYANTYWMTAFNSKLCMSWASFDLLMAMTYDPTILDGVENTTRWLQRNERVIGRIGEEALDAAGEELDSPEDLDSRYRGFSNCPQGVVHWPQHMRDLYEDESWRKWMSHLSGGVQK